MGSMAPTDCATPALVVGSNLLRWACTYRIANFSLGDPTVGRNAILTSSRQSQPHLVSQPRL